MHTSICRLIVLLCLAGLAGCDTAPGPQSTDLRPPRLSQLEFSPQELDLTSLEDGAGDVLPVAFEIEVTATDPDRDLATVTLIMYKPAVDADPLIIDTLTPAGENRYALSRDINIRTAETGNYTLFLYAEDAQGMMSNQVRGTFKLSNTSEPPVVEAIEAPDTVQRPPAGQSTRVLIVAVVSDPDGLANINSVVFWNVDRPNETLSLFDDGNNGGDEVANDGRYSITVVVTNDNAVGDNTFAFQATDRSGLQSNILEKTITIE